MSAQQDSSQAPYVPPTLTRIGRTAVRNRHLFDAISALTFVLVMAVVWTAFWWLRPIHVLDISDLRVISRNVQAGTVLYYQYDYCKHVDREAEVYFAWIDSISYPTAGMTMRELDMGCHTTSEAIYVPNIPPGVYRLQMSRAYQVTPLQRDYSYATSQPFTIVK